MELRIMSNEASPASPQFSRDKKTFFLQFLGPSSAKYPQCLRKKFFIPPQLSVLCQHSDNVEVCFPHTTKIFFLGLGRGNCTFVLEI